MQVWEKRRERAEEGGVLVYDEPQWYVVELRPPARFLIGVERNRSRASPLEVFCGI
jgi:hypothetical protein